mgnify:FL=1
MSVFMSVLVIAYCAVGFFMHLGMKAEYKKDKSTDLDEFSPVFIQMSLFAVAALWPILVGVAIYQVMTKEKE